MKLFWYALQIVVFVTVFHLYTTEIAPTANLGHIAFFAALCSYIATVVLSKTLDGVMWVLLAPSKLLTHWRLRQQTGHKPWVHSGGRPRLKLLVR